MKRLTPLIVLILAASTANAQPADLFAGLLTSLPENPEVVIQELTLPPGYVGSPHRHNAWVYVYVVEGAVDMQVEGGDVVRVSAGELFVENPKDVHTVMNNPSGTDSARFVAFMIKADGAPVVAPVD